MGGLASLVGCVGGRAVVGKDGGVELEGGSIQAAALWFERCQRRGTCWCCLFRGGGLFSLFVLFYFVWWSCPRRTVVVGFSLLAPAREWRGG